MKRRERGLAPVRSTLLGVAALATWAGVLDVVRAAHPLGPGDSLVALLLWLLLALPVALAGAAAVGVAARLLPAGLPVALSVGGVASAAVALAAALGFVAPATAVVTAGICFALFAAASRGRDGGALGAAAAAALVLAFGAAAITGMVRSHGSDQGAPSGAPQAPAPAAAGSTRPHVVMIVLDTQRADYLGAYGRPGGLSPRFDALAAESTLFTRAFATAPWTVPSHASLFTGLYPRTHGASFANHRWLDAGFTTLAEALRAAGYRTAAFSANRFLEASNLLQGFEHVESLGARFEDLWLQRPFQLLGWPARWIDHGAADGVERVGRYLADGADDARPLFLFVNLLEPHWRHLPPLADRLAALPPGLSPLTATRISTQYYGPLLMAGKRIEGPVPEAVRALYAGAVHYQDGQLGRLLSLVDERLGRDRTLLVVTADHGENLGEAGRWDHVFAVDDYLAHVPLVVRYPPRFAAGAREEGMCQLVDVTRTVAELTGVEIESDASARSLVRERFAPRPFVVVEGDPYLGHLDAMSAYTGLERDVVGFAAELRAVRDDRYKYVWSSRAPAALYDLASDPDEALDVSGSDPAHAAALAGLLDAWLAEHPPYAGAAGEAGSGMSEEERARLRSLGYAR